MEQVAAQLVAMKKRDMRQSVRPPSPAIVALLGALRREAMQCGTFAHSKAGSGGLCSAKAHTDPDDVTQLDAGMGRPGLLQNPLASGWTDLGALSGRVFPADRSSATRSPRCVRTRATRRGERRTRRSATRPAYRETPASALKALTRAGAIGFSTSSEQRRSNSAGAGPTSVPGGLGRNRSARACSSHWLLAVFVLARVRLARCRHRQFAYPRRQPA